jgi:hypothetical protein
MRVVAQSSWRVAYGEPVRPVQRPAHVHCQELRASFTFGFYHWNSPFATIVEETAGSETRTLPRKDLVNYYLPLYRACGAGRP